MSTTGRKGGARALAPRAIRMRNACVCHAAAQLGLKEPGREELSVLADETSLREAVAWWQARALAAVAEPPRASRSPLLLKAAVVMAVTLIGLAFSYSPVE
jgi:hypothetical protein